MYPPQYSAPPPGYSYEYHTTPPRSPAYEAYYSPRDPRYHVNCATPSPRGSPKTSGHTRRSSQPQNFASPRGSYEYPSQQYRYSTPPRNHEYVSDFEHIRQAKARARQAAEEALRQNGKPSRKDSTKRKTSRSQYVYVVEDDYGYRDAPPPYSRYPDRKAADQYYSRHQAADFAYNTTYAKPTATRSRRQSDSTRPKPPPPKQPKPSPKATEEDARRAGIPAGYSYKNWDPQQEPILLLGSVFDANSLGKWIYDWTVFAYGPATPMSEVAGDLWLLLIQLAGKVKRADDLTDKIRKTENREMVEEFLESGERIWIRFKKLLKVCEEYMWKAAKRENKDKKPVQMGKNSGCEFVNSIFGRDRELQNTEKLMAAMRTWGMRFDANCEDILRNPSA